MPATGTPVLLFKLHISLLLCLETFLWQADTVYWVTAMAVMGLSQRGEGRGGEGPRPRALRGLCFWAVSATRVPVSSPSLDETGRAERAALGRFPSPLWTSGAGQVVRPSGGQ